jgi:hypothetical protein
MVCFKDNELAEYDVTMSVVSAIQGLRQEDHLSQRVQDSLSKVARPNFFKKVKKKSLTFLGSGKYPLL